MPPKKKPEKADSKQQILSFGAGKKITSDDEKHKDASTIDISKNPSAAKPLRLNKEEEE